MLFALLLLSVLAYALLNHKYFLIGRFMQDTMLWADAVYRLSLGQQIHSDFHTPIGALMFLVPAGFYELTGSMGLALKASLFAFGCLTLATGLCLTLGRLPMAMALLLAAFCTLAVSSPMMFGGGHRDLTMALHYNRIGWVFLLLTATALLPRRRSTRGLELLDGWILALLGIVLFFAKISFFLTFLGLIVLGLLAFGAKRVFWVALALLALGLIGVALLFSDLFLGYIADVMAVISVSGGRIKPMSEFLSIKGEIFLFLAGCVFLLHALRLYRLLPDPKLMLRTSLVLGAVLLASLMNFNQNFQYQYLLTLAFPWLWAANVIYVNGDQSPRFRQPRAALSLVSAVFILAILSVPMVDWARGLRVLAKPPPRGEEMLYYPGALDGLVQNRQSSALHESFAAGDDFPLSIEAFQDQILPRLSMIYWRNSVLAQSYLSGLALLKPVRHAAPKLRIESIDFMNPFPMLTRTIPPKGVMIARSLREIDFANPPDPSKILSDAQIVMVPRYPQDRQVSHDLLCAYETYLSEKFVAQAMNGYWYLLIRRETLPNSLASPVAEAVSWAARCR
ncbi:hypothetical protein ACFSUD_11210 [Sulfitobacter aestuarii]|uniref:Glycosyltransferase RgtA/B/C/D-like domain-containing protein n=1 Tax=Sulfitobacter aestuarii TaxID=2161676 RepID=A0ABW5U5Y4_9RHOB